MKHGRRTSRTRTTTRRRIVAGIVTCAAIGALTGTGIASATSGETQRVGMRQDDPSCSANGAPMPATVVLVVDWNQIQQGDADTAVSNIKEFADLLSADTKFDYKIATYIYGDTVTSSLQKDEIANAYREDNVDDVRKKLAETSIDTTVLTLNGDLSSVGSKFVTTKKASLLEEKFDLSTAIHDDLVELKVAFDADLAKRLFPSANPAVVGDLKRSGNSGSLTIDSATEGYPQEFSGSFLLINGSQVVQCESQDQALTLPIKLSVSGVSDSYMILASNDDGTKYSVLKEMEPAAAGYTASQVKAFTDRCISENTQTTSGKIKGLECEDVIREIGGKPDSSSGPILAGGVIGLLVGGGAGAALMASRRRNDGTQPGFGTGMAVAGGPPHPYGPGPGGHTTALATDAWGNPIMASATPPPGPAVADLARAKRTDQTPREWTVAVPGGTAVRLDDVGTARLMPRVTDNGVVWAMGRQDVAATSGWFEKRRGKGEDAEPTLRIHSSGRGIIGVYDGTGGAGATVARTTGDGTELSGAWVASRLVRDVVESWFAIAVSEGDRALETGELASTLHKVLADEATHLPAARTGVRGSLHRVLPTTAACVAFDAGANGGTIDALWAGDSRAFVLSPGSGLQALTRDDTREDDALELIRNDQPMENLIAADRPFRVNHRRYGIASPIVLVTATDGAFGYVRTPAHFEYLLLHALVTADSMNDWSARLLAAFAEFAADDVSFSMAAIGFASFAELKAQLAARHDYLAAEHWKPFVDNTGDAEAIERLREDSWKVYKDLYVEKLSEPDVAIGAEQRPAGQ